MYDTLPVSTSKRHNINDENIDMKLNLSSTNNMWSTTYAAVYEKPADTTEKEN